jgi:hypothetical protein
MDTSTNRTAGYLLVVQALLLFVPMIVLGSSINWPASLSEPAGVMLPLIREQAAAVLAGYFVYLLFSVLFWPTSLFAARALVPADGGLARLAAGFGVASAVARTLGIVRWLGPMPILAALYTDGSTSAEGRATIEVVYTVLNSYGGTIGEVLGVSLFAGLWMALVASSALRSGTLPRWLALAGLGAAALQFVPLVELAGYDLGPLITVTVSAAQLWMLGVGFVLLRRGTAPAAQLSPSAT